MNILSMYLHRYLRLTPMLCGLIFMTMTLVRFLASGPFWPFMIDHFTGTCTRYWWSTLFYVQNYVNPNALVIIETIEQFKVNFLANFSNFLPFHSKCFAQAWYLSPDMHLFLISPFVVYLLHRYKMKAIFVFLVLMLACFGFTVAIHLIYNFTNLYGFFHIFIL